MIYKVISSEVTGQNGRRYFTGDLVHHRDLLSHEELEESGHIEPYALAHDDEETEVEETEVEETEKPKRGRKKE